MLTRKRAETINTDLTITGQNEPDITFGVTYRNLTGKQFDEAVNITGADTNRPQFDLIGGVLRMVEKWDTEYALTEEGLQQAEDDRAGILHAVIQGFHLARRVKLVGN